MADEAQTYLCPHCGVPMTPPGSGESFVRCPACNEAVLLTNDSQQRDAQLNGLRVHQLAASRRAAMRVQTYLVVAVVGCLAASAECIYKSRYTGGWNITRILLLVLAICSAWGSVFFLRHALKIARELREPLTDEPTSPPDFSNLGDGSQRVKDLENLTGHR